MQRFFINGDFRRWFRALWIRPVVGLSAMFFLLVVWPEVTLPRFSWSQLDNVFLAVQLLIGICLWAIIAAGISVATSVLRIVGARVREGHWSSERTWFFPEAAAIASVVTVAWLGVPETDTYTNPHGEEYIEIRLPSLLEGPLGINECSDVFVPVWVNYVGGKHLNIVNRASEGKEEDAAIRAKQRRVLWGTGTPARAVVILPETGTVLFFPEPMPHVCPRLCASIDLETHISTWLQGK